MTKIPHGLVNLEGRGSNISQHGVLLLNADYRPLSYRPLSIISWEHAMFYIVKSEMRVNRGEQPIIHVIYYQDKIIHSAKRAFQLPSVVALTKMVSLPGKPALTRNNIFLRDDFTCQYSGKKCNKSELTLDHVIPLSKGGRSTWENLVTCHRNVNFKKGSKTVEEAGLQLLKRPIMPSSYALQEKARSYPIKIKDERWREFVGDMAELF